MEIQVRKLGPMSLAKIMGALDACIGLIVGAIFSLFSLIGFGLASSGAAGNGDENAAIGLLFGVGAIVILPIFYGIFGFIGGLIMGVIYNLVAAMVGGVVMHVEGEIVAPAPAATPPYGG